VDLFSGLGTFALATRAKYAAEASRDAAAALKRAAPAVTVEHRDLYRRPLDRGELKSFDAGILDPPRAGAAEQISELAKSSVRRIAYVSCNPATFGRDARVLVDGGYKLDWVDPVGQFRWSTHVELAACFTRDG
jgi:23S rRNA (uracil1939-C5)-methyltransferase